LAKCPLCAPGRFGNTTGLVTCFRCPTAQYQDRFGQTGCVDCDVGTIAPQTGTSVCARCQAGEFLNRKGQTACDECGPGERCRVPCRLLLIVRFRLQAASSIARARPTARCARSARSTLRTSSLVARTARLASTTMSSASRLASPAWTERFQTSPAPSSANCVRRAHSSTRGLPGDACLVSPARSTT
jgi:hypothetical protein